MARPKVGVQLSPAFGKRTVEDLPGVLREVRAAEFDGVEAGLLCGGEAAEAGRTLDDHALVQWSVHTGFGPSYRVDEEIDYLNTLGGMFVVVSGVGYKQSGGLYVHMKRRRMCSIGLASNAELQV